MPPTIEYINVSRSTGLWEQGYFTAQLDAEGVVTCTGPGFPATGEPRTWRLPKRRMLALAKKISESGIFDHVCPEALPMHDATFVGLEIRMSDRRSCEFPSQQASELLDEVAETIAKYLEVYG